MTRTAKDDETRRDFLSQIGRWSLLTVILGGATALLTRPDTGEVSSDARCSRCPALSRCGESRAATARLSADAGARAAGEPLCDDFSPATGRDGSR